jgi:hypothetical protein
MSDEAPKPADTKAEKPDEVEEIVDDILRDFAEILPPDLLEDTREMILDAFEAHPNARAVAERLRERPAPDRSGTEATLEGEGAKPSKASGDTE